MPTQIFHVGKTRPSRVRAAAILVACQCAATCGVVTTAIADELCDPVWDVVIGQPGLIGGNVGPMVIYEGDLIVGGRFTHSGSQVLNHIARWDGANWQPLASGGQIGVGDGIDPDGTAVRALFEYNGHLIVGGNFTTAGGQVVNHLARWDGTSWLPFPPGVSPDSNGVATITAFNGDLIIGGNFGAIGGLTVNRVARWDGENWHAMSSGGQTGVGGGGNWVIASATFDGSLYIGGRFASAGGETMNSIARWDGQAWHSLSSGGQIGVAGGGSNPYVRAMIEHEGKLAVGGDFETAGGLVVNRIAAWDGSEWHPYGIGFTEVGSLDIGVSGLALFQDHLIAGGRLLASGKTEIHLIAQRDDAEWVNLDAGITGITASSIPTPNAARATARSVIRLVAPAARAIQVVLSCLYGRERFCT
jgi:hypothetical protein